MTTLLQECSFLVIYMKLAVHKVDVFPEYKLRTRSFEKYFFQILETSKKLKKLMKLLKGRSYIHANIHIYMHIYVHIYVDRQIDRYVTLSNIHDRPSFEKTD